MVDTDRLILRPLTTNDTSFIFKLLNEPAFIKNIGDRGIKEHKDALAYIQKVLDSCAKYGFRSFFVSVKETGEAAGICGLNKRDYFEHPDLGFAFLEKFWGKGYALEASRAVIKEDCTKRDIKIVLAITTQENEPSIRLLKKLGFVESGTVLVGPETLNQFQLTIP